MTESPYSQPPSPPTSAQWSPGGPTGPRASFFRRLGAVLVDWVLFAVLGTVVGVLFRQGVGSAVGLIAWLAYLTYFEGSEAGQTVGKRALGIRVIDFAAGGPIGYGRAFIRAIGRYLSAIPCFLGYFWMLWDNEKQTWHDKLANDVVVPVDAYPVSRWP
jgi:uncharacterized RDD family membrane protein YckC